MLFLTEMDVASDGTRGEPLSEESAAELKNKGNDFFKRETFSLLNRIFLFLGGLYDESINMYSLAIEKEPSAILYGNRCNFGVYSMISLLEVKPI